MKKVGGNCLFFVFIICAVVFGSVAAELASFPNLEADVVQAATDTYFYDRHYYFKKFDYSSGIFILRDNFKVYERTDIFFGDIVVNEDSNMTRVNKDGSVTKFVVFGYEPVVFMRGSWEATNLLSVDPFENTVIWNMPKRTPAGMYGVRVTAFEQAVDGEGNKLFHPLLDEDGNPILDAQGNPRNGDMMMVEAKDYVSGSDVASVVDGVYVILYGDELDYINVTDTDVNGKVHAVYDAVTRGVGKQIKIDVNVSGGAMIRTGLTEEVYNSAVMGNLTLAASVLLNPEVVHVRIEDLNGNLIQGLLADGTERTSEYIRADVYASHILLSLSAQLPRTKFLLKVIDPRSQEIYGLYVIDNVGKDVFYSSIGGGFFVVLGLLMLGGAVFMFVWPRVAVLIHSRKYKTIEKNIEIENDKSWKAQSAKDSYKNAMKRTDASFNDEKVTKGVGFLTKMAESRMKREIARNAGLTMEEFRELEEKAKKSDDAKRDSLSEFRRLVEEQTGVSTFGTNEEIGEAEEKPTETEPVNEVKPEREEGAPEFELLDSIEQSEGIDEELRDAIIEKHKADGVLKMLREEEDS